MRLLLANARGFTPDDISRLAALGFEITVLPEDERHYDMDFSGFEAVVCYRFFCHNDISAFSSLKYIHTTSAGLDHMPHDYIRSHGIVLDSARGAYSAPMAEFALGGVLQLYKCAPQFAQQQRSHIWQQNRELRELTGRQVCIVGAGSIGTECAKRFSTMGCRIVGICRHPRQDVEFYDAQVAAEQLDAILPESDIVILSLPLSAETRHLFDAARFEKMKPGAVLVNIARGPIADTAALLDALRSGRLSGAVADVFEQEPLPADSPLWDTENLILTPHNSFYGEGNSRRLLEIILRDAENWLKTRT